MEEKKKKKERLNQGFFKVGEAAEKTGFTPPTIRYYNLLGLVEPVSYTKGGYRLYDQKAIRKLKEIKKIREGFLSLDEIKKKVEKKFGG